MDDYTTEIAALRPTLLRIARRRLNNPAWAEDAVSETVLAALERPGAFDRRASLYTWLVSILRNKLVDQVRRHTREVPIDDDEADEFPVWPSVLGNAAAAQQAGEGPADPSAQLQQRQLMRRLSDCLQHLPERQSQAIVLRDWLGHDTGDICAQLGISANNLSVTLHRARAVLRAALQQPRAPQPAAPTAEAARVPEPA